MQKPDAPNDQSILKSVEPLLRSDKASLSLGEIVKQIESGNGPGPVLFILTLPVLLPLPPGFSMVMALPLLIVTPQIMIGRSVLWIPHWLSKKEIKRAELFKVVDRIKPKLQKVEAAVHPRLQWLTGRFGRPLVGAACTLIALVLVLPIPFANFVPSLAMSVFAIGLTRKDGAFILAGYALVILAALVVDLGAQGAFMGVSHLRSWH